MKKVTFFCSILASTYSTYSQSFRLEPIPSVTIPVTVDKMTNLVFPDAIQPAVKVSAEIVAQKVHGVDNVIEIMALHRHFTTTNLTAYGKDGHLYSFVLKYVDDTAVLNFRIRPDSSTPIQISNLPAPLPILREDARELESHPPKLHSSTRSDHLSLRLTGVFSKDSLEWLTFRMTNTSSLNFHPETIRFYLQDKHQVRRRAIQEVDIQPVFHDQPEIITRAKCTSFSMAFDPFHIAKGKRLVCGIRGKDGRIISLKLTRHVLRRISSLPSEQTIASPPQSAYTLLWPARLLAGLLLMQYSPYYNAPRERDRPGNIRA